MNYILQKKKILNIFFHIFVFLIIATTFNNKIHEEENNIIKGLEPYILDGEVTLKIDGVNEKKIREQEDLKLWYQKNNDPKILISKYLSDKKKYERYFNRDCKISESQEERKRTRWLWQYSFFKIFEVSNKINSKAPYYIQILLFSLMIFLSYLILFKTFPLDFGFKIIFLFFVVFVFSNPLGEFRFSIVDLFLMSLAFYFSKNQKFFPFIIIVTLAQLNRESGIIMSLIWLVFNNDYKKIIITILIASFFFLVFNYDIISCVINPKFYSLLSSPDGQVGYKQFLLVGKSISWFSLLKLLSINFFIPFGFIYYLLFTTREKNKGIMIITTIYLIIFLTTIPLQQVGVKLLLLPILISTIYFKQLEN